MTVDLERLQAEATKLRLLGKLQEVVEVSGEEYALMLKANGVEGVHRWHNVRLSASTVLHFLQILRDKQAGR